MVFQAFNLFPHLSVLDNVLLAPSRAHGVSKEDAASSARELLRRFGLGERELDYPDRLSAASSSVWRSCADVLEQVDAGEQRGLARARGADQGHGLVLAHLEVHAAKHLDLAVGLSHTAHLEHGRDRAHTGAPALRSRRSRRVMWSTMRASGTVTAR